MYSVGSIDPEGMLNGARTKLLSAQARITSERMNRAVLHRSLRGCALATAAALGGSRWVNGRRIAPLLSAPRTEVKRGGICPCGHYVPPAMAREQQQSKISRLDELFAAEPDRLSRLSFEVAGLYFDWSKTHLDQRIVGEFLARAERMGCAAARDALFAGEVVNQSENRAATHVAERGAGVPEDVDLATARRKRMRVVVDAIEAGAF